MIDTTDEGASADGGISSMIDTTDEGASADGGISSMIDTTDEGASADGDNAVSNHDDENSNVVGATMARGPDIKPKATQSKSTPSERPTTLKGLQMEYYRKSIHLQEAQLVYNKL
ncbi:uncharacterized protein LOC127862871 [Dreissena polymorpha]|uniref:uncharacterized protein LOC127862871 n=1 Tax=Dreissena polymorpha TaxID=45954 RepID=UPI00226418F2|nr:uncharacterized protein LOC127862871 [Dreissena polymorpha]